MMCLRKSSDMNLALIQHTSKPEIFLEGKMFLSNAERTSDNPHISTEFALRQLLFQSALFIINT
jgi:hypothetical protein